MNACTSLLTVASAPLSADEFPKFVVDIKVVNVLATVRNRAQAFVTDLVKDDFILTEDGREQIIRYFSQETDLPLTLGLVVDTSASQFQIIKHERNAGNRFFEQVLRQDKDEAFVVRFDRDADLIREPTCSLSRLDAALDQLDATDTPGWRARHPLEAPSERFWGTALFDAVDVASRAVMAKRDGRKALVVLSDGVDNASATKPLAAIASAQRADVLVYSVLFADPDAYQGQRGDPRKIGVAILRRLSKETGGSYFEITKAQSMNKVFDRIEQELRSEYSLGYISDQKDAGPGYRRIHLTTRRGDLIVQARDGYYAPG